MLKLLDKVLEMRFARQLWSGLMPIDMFKAPEDGDLRAAINPILGRLHKMAYAFSDFAGYFIRNQTET